MGITAESTMNDALASIASVLRASPDELVFTSCGTESINTAIRGALEAYPARGRHIITTGTEHSSVLQIMMYLKKFGYEITYLPVSNSGLPDVDDFARAIRKDTVLVSMTHVNNETGTICPIHEYIRAARKTNSKVSFHLDCVQSLGKLSLDLRMLDIDYASFSGHKIHCVKGIGLLYVRKGSKINPLIIGGGQQRGYRSGTESPYLYKAMALALSLAENSREESFLRVLEQKNHFCYEISHLGAIIHSPDEGSPYIVNASFPGFHAETMLHALEENDIYVSTVSACASKSKKVSHVLQAMGVQNDLAKGAVRFSFSRYTNRTEIDETIKTLTMILSKYRLK
jgi:cysteine desulfurase